MNPALQVNLRALRAFIFLVPLFTLFPAYLPPVLGPNEHAPQNYASEEHERQTSIEDGNPLTPCVRDCLDKSYSLLWRNYRPSPLRVLELELAP